MQKQVIETRARKKNRGMHIDLGKCRLRGRCIKGVMYLANGCQMLAVNEYLKRHNSTLKVLMTKWAVEKGYLEKASTCISKIYGYK